MTNMAAVNSVAKVLSQFYARCNCVDIQSVMLAAFHFCIILKKELIFACINMFLARLRLILARARNYYNKFYRAIYSMEIIK